MFTHGWSAYLKHAFPDDELRPLTCDGLERDPVDPSNSALNDALGSYSLTLVDSLDMFAVLGDSIGFANQVERVRRYVQFDVPSTVQVFETTIRGLGGLLSAHILAATPSLGMSIKGYDGFLLGLALDLGERLLPAFDTVSGIPSPRVNLRHGVKDGAAKITNGDAADVTETCTSGAGSLLLEFGLLSRLTGDRRFDRVAREAFFELYENRTLLDLVPMSVDSQTGEWLAPLITGPGAGIDSFYEYALKYAILFNDDTLMSAFTTMYRALKAHSYDSTGWAFRNVNSIRGGAVTRWIDALGSFLPSVMVLAGDMVDAAKVHLVYYNIWTTFGAIPERFNLLPRTNGSEEDGRSINTSNDTVALEWYPLRPEFMESNYYLYQATKDPFYLLVGERVMRDLQKFNKVACGYAGVQDVRTGQLSDRMESFFLSETVKYLYLLFDEANPLNNEKSNPKKSAGNSNFVFTTEGHLFWYDAEVIEHAGFSRFENLGYMATSAKVEVEVEVEAGNGSDDTVSRNGKNGKNGHENNRNEQNRNENNRNENNGNGNIRNRSRDKSSESRVEQLLILQNMETEMVQQKYLTHGISPSSSRYWYQNQCEVMPKLTGTTATFYGFYSSQLGSWNRLYEAGSMYQFKRPVRFFKDLAAIEDSGRSGSGESTSDRTSVDIKKSSSKILKQHVQENFNENDGPDHIIISTLFYARYVNPQATCAVPESQNGVQNSRHRSSRSKDIVIGRAMGELRGRVLYRTTKRSTVVDQPGAVVVVVSSLYGLRVRIGQMQTEVKAKEPTSTSVKAGVDDDGLKRYVIESIDGIRVESGSVVYVNKLSTIKRKDGTGFIEVVSSGEEDSEEDSEDSEEEECIWGVEIEGKKVENLKVVGCELEDW